LSQHELPAFQIRWDDPDLPEDKAGCTAPFEDGRILVCLRSDLTPARVFEVALHELQHVIDIDLVRAMAAGTFSRETLEERARATAARLSGL
jgi:hypothetical protein